ncbi:MAG: peptidoglycan D,D-transpeptidase FtsI family protein [Tumebacillaceae bacterium]
MEQEKDSATGKRMSLLFMLIFIALAVLIWRLSFIQLTSGDEYVKLAEGNRYITQSIPAPRGIIFDSKGKELVGNKPAYTITFQRLGSDVQDPMMLVAQLSPADALNMDPVKLFNAMDPFGEKYSLGTARKVITNATPKQVAYVREHMSELPGFNVVVEPIRNYLNNPQDGMPRASHVLGYLNNIPQDIWNKNKDTYQQTDVIGWAGVEMQYENLLRGKSGTLKVEVNKNYQPPKDQRTDEPIKGHDLVLTIDSHLQYATEKALADQVKIMHQSVPSVKNASAVAINPKTGEVLAMASYPDYDPNEWIGGMTDKQYLEDFSPGEMNRTMTQNYFPGSTVKMATSLIGMKTGTIWPTKLMNDPGYVQVGWKGPNQPNNIYSWASLGTLDMYGALAQSSNVYMIKTFLDMAGYNNNFSGEQAAYFLQNTLPKYMKMVEQEHEQLGLGVTKTGIDLPYETKGTFDDQGRVGDLAYAAIGQIERYSMIQLAQYVGTIANNGVRMKPHVLKQVIDPDGKKEPVVAPQVVNKIDFSQDEVKAVQQGMYDVTHGTGTFASVFGNYSVPVAGKTGTAETGISGQENSLFVGYAPYNDPTIAIAIIIPDNEHNSHSYNSVGPIAKAMMNAYFKFDEKQTKK